MTTRHLFSIKDNKLHSELDIQINKIKITNNDILNDDVSILDGTGGPTFTKEELIEKMYEKRTNQIDAEEEGHPWFSTPGGDRHDPYTHLQRGENYDELGSLFTPSLLNVSGPPAPEYSHYIIDHVMVPHLRYPFSIGLREHPQKLVYIYDPDTDSYEEDYDYEQHPNTMSLFIFPVATNRDATNKLYKETNGNLTIYNAKGDLLKPLFTHYLDIMTNTMHSIQDWVPMYSFEPNKVFLVLGTLSSNGEVKGRIKVVSRKSDE